MSVPEAVFPGQSFYTWNSLGPRAGITYDIAGDGKTVIKASYGLFWHNPGPGINADCNPNQNNKSVTYVWNDRNGDRRYRPGEEGNVTNTTLAGSIQLDPGITQPFSHDVALYLERQLGESLGARIGYVYKSEDDLIALYNPFRPIESYTVPFSFVDVGVDGRAEQQDRVLAQPGEVDAVTWAAIHSQLPDAIPTEASVAGVPRGKAIDTSQNGNPAPYVPQAVEPALKWILALGRDVVKDLHGHLRL